MAAIITLVISGCATSGTLNEKVSTAEFQAGTPVLIGNETMQAGTICNRNPAGGGSVITTSSAVNPKGYSAAVQSEISNWVGDDNCRFVVDRAGNRIPAGRIGQAYTQNVDIMEKVITGGLGILQAGSNGYLAAKAVKGCGGGNCGAPIIVQATSQSGSSAEAGVETNNGQCTTDACGAPDN
jgi:hypothetical protein